ncbi:hypothetical protein NESM_000081900 [Novymonas esmeraldas]|uniref:Uncharacterized protein n=1 Tax=Novymonas esmeraldas TaxID=1808958 RepID=A0AAW0F4E3_9TRYP
MPSTMTARRLKDNALFRVLAFLDSTGVQPFALDAEVDADGDFLDPGRLFAADTAITGVLTAALDALRANVRRLFADAAEQHALLRVLGTGAPDPGTGASPWIVDAAAAAPAEARTDGRSSVPDSHRASSSLSCTPPSPVPAHDTPWSASVLHPTSLANYADSIENEIPLHLLLRLREVLGIAADTTPVGADGDATAAASSSSPCAPSIPGCCRCCTASPFAEQLLIDGLDEWLRRCPVTEVRRMILACGVQPAVCASAFAAQSQAQAPRTHPGGLPDALVDFVVDVVFPLPSSAGESASASVVEGLQDWLLLSYEKNREAVQIDEDGADSESAEEDRSSSSSSSDGPAAKRGRLEGVSPSPDGTAGNLGAWAPADGEEVLTAENIERYMRECPQRIPREVLRQARKRISDATITEFELEHHYTAAELKKLVKDDVGGRSASEATELLQCAVTAEQVEQAARLTRKAQFIAWVLSLHRTTADASRT